MSARRFGTVGVTSVRQRPMGEVLPRVIGGLSPHEGAITSGVTDEVDVSRRSNAAAARTTSHDNVSLWERDPSHAQGEVTELPAPIRIAATTSRLNPDRPR